MSRLFPVYRPFLPAVLYLYILAGAGPLYAQPLPDSAAVSDTAAVPDSLTAADSTARKAGGKDKTVMKDSVLYWADTITFEMADDRISLYGNARVRYQGVELSAHQIHLNTKTRTVDAAGVLRADSADTQWTGTPVLVEKNDRVEGFSMTYNLESRKGRINMGTTEFENGYFNGPEVAIVDDKTLNARNGRFTTCGEHDDPHYHFASRRMKLYVNDKIIIRPVILKVNRIPVMALPFFIFPVKKERHSGFLIPRYGSNSDYGRYLKNLGYYWAPSDYFDARGSMDFYTESRAQVNGQLRFARRYLLSGRVSGSYIRTGNGSAADQHWNMSYGYNHNLPGGWTLSGSGEFTSDRNYFEDYTETVTERSKRNLRSSLNLNKRWSSSSLNISGNQNQVFLDTSTVTSISLPQASFSTSGNLFSGRRGTGRNGDEDPWYTDIRYTYRSGFSNALDKTSSVGADTGEYINTVKGNQYGQLRYTAGLLSWLSVSPQISYTENYTWWQKTDSSYQTGTYQPSVSVTAQQDIYGLFPVNRAGIEAFRHVVHPSATYSYSYSQIFKRYTQTYMPLTPTDEAAITRGSSVSLGLTNLFQCKLNRNGQEKKPTLLTGPNFTTGYDFFSEKFSQVRTHMHTSIRMVNLNLDFTHSLYDETGEDLLLSHPDPDRRRLWRETDRTFSLSTHFDRSRQIRYYDDIRRYSIHDDADLDKQVVATVERPFSARVNYSISFRKNADKPTQNLYGGFSANLTRNWKADYSGTYDLENFKFLSQTITLVRDMHCWEARLLWHPTGYQKDLELRIFVKDLPEVKVEKSVRYN